MEITMAEVVNEIKHIKKSQDSQSEDIKEILRKFDNLDNKYASKNELYDIKREFNWIKVAGISLVFSAISFLIKYVFF